MKKKPKYAKPTGSSKKSSKTLIIVLICIDAALVLALAIMLIIIANRNEPDETLPTGETTIVTEAATTEVTEAITDPVETEPVETEPVMLPEMAAFYEENPDIVGWIRIDGTKLDYPVMFTPDEEERYLRANFEGKFDLSGLPFIDKDCSMDPESDNLIIYGHNMMNGTAFATIMSYAKKSFWEDHPTIYFSTLYEERTYEIIAAFYDRVYYKYEDVFKFYQFIDYETEEEFNEAIANYRKKAQYDTGVIAEYGDRLITLVTCAYHVDDGRFVVVAREVTEEAE